MRSLVFYGGRHPRLDQKVIPGLAKKVIPGLTPKVIPGLTGDLLNN